MNNKINDEIFTVVLRSAFVNAFQAELSEYEAEEKKYLSVSPTPEQKKESEKVYNKATKAPIRTSKIFTRVAACILLVFSLGSGLMLSAPKVRAAVADTMVEFFDKYLSFDFLTKTEPVSLGEYTLYYLPKGYELDTEDDFASVGKYVFSNGSAEIVLSSIPTAVGNISVDNENRTMQHIEIPNYTSYALIPNNSQEATILVWGNEERTFMIIGNIELNELIKIAKNLD